MMKRFSTTVYANEKDGSSTTLGTSPIYGSNCSLSSMMSGASVGTTGTASSMKSTGGAGKRSLPKKNVRWTTKGDQMNDIDCFKNLPAEHKAELWYEGRAMGLMRKSQIRELKSAQREANAAGKSLKATNPNISWRGFEDIRDGFCRVEKSSTYTSEVVRHYHTQLDAGYTDVEELKRIGKGLSKPERQRVRDLGIADAKSAGSCANASKRKKKPRRSGSGISVESNDSKDGGLRRKTSFAGLVGLMKKTAIGKSASKSALNGSSHSATAQSKSKGKNATWTVRSSAPRTKVAAPRTKVAAPC